MKILFAILSAVAFTAAQAQTSSDKGTIDAEKQTTATPIDQIKKAQGIDTGKPDRSAGAGGSLTVENSKLKKPAQVRQIPDGSYGTNRTGLIYSPENPNYPYDRNGKLIRTPNTQITKGKSGHTDSPELQGKPLEPSTRL